MTRFRIGSTLLCGCLLASQAGAAHAQQPDSTAARSSWAVYAGFDEGFTFIAGGQIWLRTPIRAVSLVPELAIGHGASLLAGAGIHLDPLTSRFRPYAGISAGYLWMGSDDDADNGVVVTPKAGILLGTKSFYWMLEYQGVDWFTSNRVLVGIRQHF